MEKEKKIQKIKKNHISSSLMQFGFLMLFYYVYTIGKKDENRKPKTKMEIIPTENQLNNVNEINKLDIKQNQI